jgi:prephenate dehydratase/chorismate mutase/prephenate dehydratase
MSLDIIRKNIDRIDSKILNLLGCRMELALMAKKFKSQIEDIEREKKLLERIKRNSTGVINSEFLEKIYNEILRESKHLQKEDFKLIAFQGEHGAYGEIASERWNGDLVPIPCPGFSDVFEGVKTGSYDYAIVPVENTLGGVVGEVNELVINMDLYVVGAIELPIHHCLLALPGSDHREIRFVYSHSQALSQCRHFLARNKLEPVLYNDTAGAAKMLAEETPKMSAAIASKLAAGLYHLEIIKEDIEDLERNMTRFLVLSREESREAGDKCSVLFSTEHKAGTLFSVLEVFAKEHINLTRIESIPNEPGNYAFFLDFVGSNRDEKVLGAMERVHGMTTDFRFLGCYKERKIA